MKIKIIIGACLMMFYSCTDLMDKEPLDKYSGAVIWTDLSVAEAFVNNVYRILPGVGWDDIPRGRGLSCISDEALHSYGYYGVEDMNKGMLSPSNTTQFDTWKMDYEHIKMCNDFFENYDNLPATTPDEIEKKNRLKGEIHCLRAYCYFDLAQRFGGVPLVKKSFTLTDDFTMERSTFEQTVQFITEDCNAATELLPLQYDDVNWGRLTKGAAMALKSRLLLYAASPLFNPSNDRSKWEVAAQASKGVIDLNVDGAPLYSLYLAADAEHYNKLFLDKKHPEMIMFRVADVEQWQMDLPELTEGPGGGVDGAGVLSGWCSTQISQNLVDAFEMSDGSKFDWNNLEHAANPYANRDPRLKFDIYYDGSSWNGSTIDLWLAEKDNNYTKDPRDKDFVIDKTPGASGKNSNGNPVCYYKEVSKTGYGYRKALNTEFDFKEEPYPYYRPWMIFRYAEILLNYAECLYNLGDETNARLYINKIRNRVGMPAITATGSELEEKIRNERRIELCLEGHRYFDVRRWKIAEQALNEPITGVIVVKDKNSDKKIYTKTLIEERTFTAPQHYLLPIPQYELEKVSLEQNPGY